MQKTFTTFFFLSPFFFFLFGVSLTLAERKQEEGEELRHRLRVAAMEFTVATTTFTKKLSNGSGYGVSGRSAYDGVFATPIKLHTPKFSSQFDDYREIFCTAKVSSLDSLFPTLELSKLNERKKNKNV